MPMRFITWLCLPVLCLLAGCVTTAVNLGGPDLEGSKLFILVGTAARALPVLVGRIRGIGVARTPAEANDINWAIVCREIGSPIKLKVVRFDKHTEHIIEAKMVEDEPAVLRVSLAP